MQETNLAGYTISIIGGDARDVVLAYELAERKADVWLHGFSRYPEPMESHLHLGLPEDADVVIFPLPGVHHDGSVFAAYSGKKIYITKLKKLFKPGTLLLCGRLEEEHGQFIEAHGVKIIETMDLNELAIYNAIPTAEGALEVAIRESQLTIHGSKALVTGFGRCAQPLARMLKALGAEVTIAARKRDALADARTQGFNVINFPDLQETASQFDFMFNTVPSLVLSNNVLAKTRKDVLIIDIASSPGGVDFVSAKDLNRKAFLLPGLPGKTAPVTSGKILANIYPHYIRLHKKGGEHK